LKTPVRLLALTLALAGCRAAPEAAPDAADVAARNEAKAVAATPVKRPVPPPPVEWPLPPLAGRVVDMANLLTPEEEASLTARLAAFEAQTTNQLVIVTTPSLMGESIEAYGRRLGNGWGIGQRGRNNGVLLIVAPNDRQTRIEVGRGLEPILTNARAAEIIRQDIVPHFRESRWLAGIEGGIQSIIATLGAADGAQRGQR
jgi:uncharacterized membrane protein YgcG